MHFVEATTELVVEKSESAATEPTIIPESPVSEEIGTKEKVERASSADKNVCTEIVSKQNPPQSKVNYFIILVMSCNLLLNVIMIFFFWFCEGDYCCFSLL